MPAVTLLSNPKGEPIANTHSPTLSLLGSPWMTLGRSVASILRRAISVLLSAPITRARNSRLSVSFTVISSADSMTCALVRMYPSVLTINPDPSDLDSNSRGAVLGGMCLRKSSKNGSSSGMFGIPGKVLLVAVLCVWTVLILTTEEPCFSTKSVKSGRPLF